MAIPKSTSDLELLKFKESTAVPGVAGIIIVNPDGTSIAGGGGGSTTVTAHAAAQSFTESSTNPLQGDLTGALKVNVVAGGGAGGTSSTFNATFPGTGTAAGFVDQNGKMQAASVAAFHAGDNTVITGSGLGVLTGGVTQIKNAIGNLDRQTEAGLDNTSALGVTTGAAQFAVPFPVTISAAITGSVTAQIVTPGNMLHIFVGTVLNHDSGASNEAVVVTVVTATTFTAVFLKSHAVSSTGQAFYYNQGRDAAIGDKVPVTGLSPSVTYLVNTITGLAEQDRSAAGELDGATGTGTAIAAEYEFNGSGPMLSTGFASGLSFDRARSLQAKGVGVATQGAGGAINTTSITASLAANTNSLQAGQQVRLDRNTATEETAYIAQSYISGTAAITLQSNLQFNHTAATIEWDIFASAGPGLNGFTATGIGIEEEALYNPVDNKYYIERASTQDAMPAANIVAESGVVWNGTTFDRERAAYQDGLATTGIPAEAEMLFNGSTFDRARSLPASDGQASTGFGADGIMLFNGTTYDRLKGTSGAAAVSGGAAVGATPAANPVNTGAKAVNAEQTAVTTGQIQQLITDLVGKLITLPYANPENFKNGSNAVAITTTASTSIIAAQGAGVRLYATGVTITNSHATVGTLVQITDGAAGTVLHQVYCAPAGGGESRTFPVPLKSTANNGLFAACITTGANVYVSLDGYIGS